MIINYLPYYENRQIPCSQKYLSGCYDQDEHHVSLSKEYCVKTCRFCRSKPRVIALYPPYLERPDDSKAPLPRTMIKLQYQHSLTIKETVAQWTETFETMYNKRDFATLIDKFYAEESKTLMSDGKLVRGKKGTNYLEPNEHPDNRNKELFQKWMAQPDKKATWVIEDVFESGDFVTTIMASTLTEGVNVVEQGSKLCANSIGIFIP
uniref:SnoaL-like domain-containing protein n=1 Tax=Romanomermis culicivorax TaxID=13658 RepID=A0A915KJK2_ROMCU